MYDYDFIEATERAAGFLSRTPLNNDSVDPRIEETRFIAYSILAPIIVIVGLVGNLLTIFVLRLPQFRGVTYTLFLVLAMSDFLALFFSISLLIHLLNGGTHIYSTAVWYSYCEAIFVNVPMSTSTFIIILITIDRYYSVCRPAQFKTVHTNRNARIGIALSLFLALVAWVPSVALKEPRLSGECPTTSFEPPDEGKWWVSCMKADIRESSWFVGYSWTRQAITTFVPVVILVVLNSLIVKEFVRLRKKKKHMVGDRPKDSPVAEQRKKHNQHLIHLLTAVTICFFVTIVPSGIFGALYDENLSTKFKFELFRALANDLEILNHALNFYLYILYSKPIRDALINTFQNKKRLVSLTFSNILSAKQKTDQCGSTKENSDGENFGNCKEVTAKHKERENNARQTQYVDVVSDHESSFNQIVPVNDPPKVKLKMQIKNSSSDNQDNSYFEYPIQNRQPTENVYQRAVMNHMNKPQNGLNTIVHTAEVHKCQSQDDSGPLDIEDKIPVKQNGHLPNGITQLVHNLETLSPNKDQKDKHGYEGDIAQNELTKNVDIVTKDTIVDIKSNVDGFDNPAFHFSEVSDSENDKVYLSNGSIWTSL